MGTLTFNSNYQQLWNTTTEKYRFYGQVRCSVSRNEANNTYTISVNGIAAHCGEWNFKTHYSISLNGKSVTGTLPASGNNNYSGWIPKDGSYQSVSLSVTVAGNTNGTCPAVNLYFRCYNDSVKWLSAGRNISVSSVYGTTNISSSVQSATGGPNDRSAPSVSISRSDVTSSSLKFSGSSNVNCSDWQYQLDGGAWISCGWGTGKGSSKTITGLSQANHNVRLWAKKSSNNVGGYSSYAYFDTRNPSISDISMTASTTNSATISFKTNYDCTYSVKNSSGNVVSSGSCSANVKVSKTIATSSSDDTYFIYVTRTYDTSLTASASVYCYSYQIKITSFTLTPFDASTATAAIQCDCAFQWRIKRPDGIYYSSNGRGTWSNDCAASTNITSNIPVENVSGTYKLEVRRSVNHNLSNSKITSCDTRLPVVSTFTLTPTSENTASMVLQLKENMSCTWTLNTLANTKPTGNISQNYSGTVTIDANALKPYTVTVARTTCSKLAASKTSANVDSKGCNLSISNISPSGTTCSFDVTADENCKDWYCQLLYEGTTTPTQKVLISSSSTNKVTFIATNIQLNRKFTIIVTAKKSSNGASCSTKSGQFECTGVGYVYDPSTEQQLMCVVYINVSTNPNRPDWRAAAPYIYDKENTTWRCATSDV